MSKKKPTADVLKAISLEEVEDKYIGKKGTPKRNAYEAELNADLE